MLWKTINHNSFEQAITGFFTSKISGIQSRLIMTIVTSCRINKSIFGLGTRFHPYLKQIMLGDLNKKELIDLLTNQVIGRLGCTAAEETYIVPINYVYRDNAIYAHSGLGKKVEMMRKNPNVCFQVDEITDTFRWKSAILWGSFVELEGEERQQALQGIIHRIMPLTDRPTEEPSHGISPEKQMSIIVFKIELTKVTGKFESHDRE